MDQKIRAKCFRDKGKLRYRIISPGYSHDAIILLHANYRKTGREFLIHPQDLQIKKVSGKFLFKVDPIKIDWLGAFDTASKEEIQMPEDKNYLTCWMCKEKKGELKIFSPCGHRFCCPKCASGIENCSLCKVRIENIISNEDLVAGFEKAGWSFE